jgi:galactokinase
MSIPEFVEKKFYKLFYEEPIIVCSPGRVNLIGEHTDYNMGYVLPGAIDKAIYFAVSSRNDNLCRLFALDMNDSFDFRITDLEFSEKGWPNYLMGVVDQLQKKGYVLKGFNCVFGGDIPIGAGLSSSAAIEAGLAFALDHIFKLGMEKLEMVKLAQKAENEFVGVKCGIMDQYINIFGKTGNVLRVDCRSLEYEYFPFDFKNVSIVLFDTNVSHSLASSEYNQRRKECSDGVSIIGKQFPGIESLRDVSLDLLHEFKAKLDPVVFRRCKYAIEENNRLLQACTALNNKDLNKFGSLMYQTHEGLSKDYEVSCKELDYLVELLKGNPKVYGSRMMGGGFGGCTINLIEKDSIEEITKYVSINYKKKFDIDSKTYVTKINNGTSIISIKENATK